MTTPSLVSIGNLTVAARTNIQVLPAAAAAATASLLSAAAAEATPSATAAGGFRTSFIHVHRTAVQLHAVQLGNRVLRFIRVRHFDEGEAARLSRIAIRNNIDAIDVPKLGERCM